MKMSIMKLISVHKIEKCIFYYCFLFYVIKINP